MGYGGCSRTRDRRAHKASIGFAATEAMRRAEDERSKQARLRASAIKSARFWGMSYDAIAERLGVFRESGSAKWCCARRRVSAPMDVGAWAKATGRGSRSG